MRPGLSVSSQHELRTATRLSQDVVSQFATVLRSPAAENIAAVTTTALLTAAALLDFVETFNIPTTRFLNLAKQEDTGLELRDAILTYIKEQKD